MTTELFTLRAAAKRLGVTYWTAWRIVRWQKLPVGYKIGGHWLLREDELYELRGHLLARPKRGRPPKGKEE